MALGVTPLRVGQEAYWLEQIARDACEYYSGKGESPGWWLGSLADRAGLQGEASEEAGCRERGEHDRAGDAQAEAPANVAAGCAGHTDGTDGSVPVAEGGAMVGWHLSEQARQALRTARTLAADRGNPAPGSADPLLAAILGQWDDAHAGGPALLRACGLTAEQASQLAAILLPAVDRSAAAASAAEPRLIGGLRFVLDQAYRIAAEARASYLGTEHLVVAMLWNDSFIGAHELRRLGVSYARAVEQLAALPATERAERIDRLEAVEVPTPAAARLEELARQQAEQHPIEGDGRISTLHHLLALMVPRSAAHRLLRELGVSYEEVTRRIAEEGAQRVAGEDWRPEEHPLEGWEEFRVTDQDYEVVRGRFHAVNKELGRRGVRFMFGKRDDDPEWSLVQIHPGESGLDPRVVLDRLLGRASEPPQARPGR